MTTDKATPRPWKVKPEKLLDGGHVAGRGPEIVNGSDTEYITRIHGDRREANASLIVRAVNAYDAHRKLVEVAQSAESIMRQMRHMNPRLESEANALREALRAIEEGEKC